MLLGVFYYSLANITPSLRSSLQSIQLIAVVKSSYIDLYGIDIILKPFMEDISRLEQVCVCVCVCACVSVRCGHACMHLCMTVLTGS